MDVWLAWVFNCHDDFTVKKTCDDVTLVNSCTICNKSFQANLHINISKTHLSLFFSSVSFSSHMFLLHLFCVKKCFKWSSMHIIYIHTLHRYEGSGSFFLQCVHDHEKKFEGSPHSLYLSFPVYLYFLSKLQLKKVSQSPFLHLFQERITFLVVKFFPYFLCS